MSGSKCCFLTCIQISQEIGKVVWYFHLFKNFPQLVVIQTVKGFSVVHEAAVDAFLEFACFFYEPTDVGNLISDSSAFSKSSLNIYWFLVHVLLKPSLENFEHSFASMIFPSGSAGKESSCSGGDLGSVSGLGRSPGEGKGYPLQYSGLESSVECLVHEVTKSQTWLRGFQFISLC